ncbi:MAG: ribonuclease catalytic domain-containing protein [Gammaproteobacteria bacterium]|nr:ribonuclease catalytic domain-containing protein [Gammaproteobacteria bacterium]
MSTTQRFIPERLKTLLQRYDIATAFPAEVEAEVRRLIDAPGMDTPELVDRTGLPFVTIDNPGSRDLDQALFIEGLAAENGSGAGYVVYYALADGSFYAPPGSALFEEALRRGVTQYFPGFSAPMLPPELSEGLVSLNEDCIRRALLFRISLDEQGECVESTFERARIRSRAKLSYPQVQDYLDAHDPSAHPLAAQLYSSSLQLLKRVGGLRIADALQRDVVRYDRQEVEVEPATDDPQYFRVVARRRCAVEEWNAQISLLCNIEGARFLAQRRDPRLDIEGIFRVHPPPGPEAIREFASWVERFVDSLDLDPDVWHWRRWQPYQESLADYIERLPDDGDAGRISMAIQRQAMLLNRRAQYSVTRGRHHAIGTPHYSRFSSPMREVIGILTHHLAICQQQQHPVNLDRELVDRVVESGNRMSALQKQINRDTVKLAMDDLLNTDLRILRDGGTAPVRIGTLMGATTGKLHVRLDSPPVDVKLYVPAIREYGGVSLSVDEDETRVFEANDGGQLRLVAHLGGRIAVRAMGYDDKKERWILGPCPKDALQEFPIDR